MLAIAFAGAHTPQRLCLVFAFAGAGVSRPAVYAIATISGRAARDPRSFRFRRRESPRPDDVLTTRRRYSDGGSALIGLLAGGDDTRIAGRSVLSVRHGVRWTGGGSILRLAFGGIVGTVGRSAVNCPASLIRPARRVAAAIRRTITCPPGGRRLRYRQPAPTMKLHDTPDRAPGDAVIPGWWALAGPPAMKPGGVMAGDGVPAPFGAEVHRLVRASINPAA